MPKELDQFYLFCPLHVGDSHFSWSFANSSWHADKYLTFIYDLHFTMFEFAVNSQPPLREGTGAITRHLKRLQMGKCRGDLSNFPTVFAVVEPTLNLDIVSNSVATSGRWKMHSQWFFLHHSKVEIGGKQTQILKIWRKKELVHS